MAELERCGQVSLDHRIPVCSPKAQHLIQLTNTGIVHQNINGTETFAAGGDNPLRHTAIGDIRQHEFQLNALLFDKFAGLRVFFAQSGNKQIRAGGRQSNGKGLPRAAITTGNDSGFSP